jgi:hypothetical protein
LSTVDDVRKAIQDFLAPELAELKGELRAIRETQKLQFEALNQRFDDLIERMQLNRRIEALERDREERRAS